MRGRIEFKRIAVFVKQKNKIFKIAFKKEAKFIHTLCRYAKNHI